MGELRRAGGFRLSYNGLLCVREGLGYLLRLKELVGTDAGSGLAFRPLRPALENPVYLIWRKHKMFSPIAQRFLEQVQQDFGSH
jgi:DNA-binding transcriptional LysR family regulator